MLEQQLLLCVELGFAAWLPQDAITCSQGHICLSVRSSCTVFRSGGCPAAFKLGLVESVGWEMDGLVVAADLARAVCWLLSVGVRWRLSVGRESCFLLFESCSCVAIVGCVAFPSALKLFEEARHLFAHCCVSCECVLYSCCWYARAPRELMGAKWICRVFLSL